MIRIGSKFSEARIRKGLSIEEVSQATKIRKEFLEAIEDGQYNKLPSTAYAYGFVRNYAKFLGLNPEQSVAIFKREFDADKAFDVLPKSFSKKEGTSKKIRVGRSVILTFGVFILIILFIFFQFKDAVFSPSLIVNEPQENQTVFSQDLQVKGVADPNSTVYVEDQLVSIDDSGNFTKIITVFPGKTSIDIKALNRFGKQTNLVRDINVKTGY